MRIIALILFILFLQSNIGEAKNIVVVDSATQHTLPGATAFDSKGKPLGMTNNNGRLPYISHLSYPITLRYLGYKEKSISEPTDTIRLVSTTTDLPEVIIESKNHKVLHILAYIREYSTLSTYTDTVSLFREKMVDYMLLPDKKINFEGWLYPRLLKSNSYYQFTNNQGLDSVSDKCRHHFSWSDWIKIVPSPEIPPNLKDREIGTDTLRGKYSATEIWTRNGAEISIDVNVLADTISRKWVSNLNGFFNSDLDYEIMKLRYKYGNVVGDSISMTDIEGYSYVIESNGRGHNMFMFNNKKEPFFVSTYAEVYILDKEYIKIKEAKKWAKMRFDKVDFDIIEPHGAPELQPSIKELIERVDNINHDKIRQNIAPDQRIKNRNIYKQQHIGQRILSIIKGITGISAYKSKKNREENWDKFKENQIKRNNQNKF